MRILRNARCHCGKYGEVIEDGNIRICRGCLSRILAFAMQNKAREPETKEDHRPPQTSKAS